jgi:Ser/Thr protein kinase RdoA (MazF antagonist)
MNVRVVALEDELRRAFGLADVELTRLPTPVNDVVVVRTPSETFALKLYHAKRTVPEVRWEVELLLHLRRLGAPVVSPVHRHGDPVQVLSVDGGSRPAVLYPWASGAKPEPTPEVYRHLGAAAAQIHRAADTFASGFPREEYDAHALVDDQLRRMRPHLVEAGRWAEVTALGARLTAVLSAGGLDRGVCHMDLTLDNVHMSEGELAVFDFDSAGVCWRAIEPYGVLAMSEDLFREWLDGYRAVRDFDRADERAVSVFTVVGDLRAVAWKLGVAESSRGRPLLSAADLPAIVDRWLERADTLPPPG